jgi:hypothetical protein
MRFLEGMRPRQARTVLWFATGIVSVVSALLLVTGLLVPGFLIDENESSAQPPEASDSETQGGDPADERPWAVLHPGPQPLTPDAAVARVATRFVGQLNAGRAAGAVEMLCPDTRRLIRGPVVWTATHMARLRITTPLKHVARPGYVTIHFVGVIQGRQRRGTIGIDADAKGQPRCVSAFYSVG